MITRILWLILILVYLAGCTTMMPVSTAPGQINSAVQVGDRVAIISRSVQTREFSVTRVTPEQICGRDECVRAEEIESVHRQEFSVLKTAGLVVGIALIVLAVGAMHRSSGGFLAH